MSFNTQLCTCGRSVNPKGNFLTCCRACQNKSHTVECNQRTVCTCGRYVNPKGNFLTCCQACQKGIHTVECNQRTLLVCQKDVNPTQNIAPLSASNKAQPQCTAVDPNGERCSGIGVPPLGVCANCFVLFS